MVSDPLIWFKWVGCLTGAVLFQVNFITLRRRVFVPLCVCQNRRCSDTVEPERPLESEHISWDEVGWCVERRLGWTSYKSTRRGGALWSSWSPPSAWTRPPLGGRGGGRGSLPHRPGETCRSNKREADKRMEKQVGSCTGCQSWVVFIILSLKNIERLWIKSNRSFFMINRSWFSLFWAGKPQTFDSNLFLCLMMLQERIRTAQRHKVSRRCPSLVSLLSPMWSTMWEWKRVNFLLCKLTSFCRMCRDSSVCFTVNRP